MHACCSEGYSTLSVCVPVSNLASQLVQYSVRDVRDGSVARVALQCTDATIRMIDTVTLCSPLVGVSDRVTAASGKEGRSVSVSSNLASCTVTRPTKSTKASA